MALPGSTMDLMSSAMSLSGAASAAVDAKSTLDSAQAAYDAACAALSADPENETLAQMVLMTNFALGSAQTANTTAVGNLLSARSDANTKHSAANTDIASFLGQ